MQDLTPDLLLDPRSFAVLITPEAFDRLAAYDRFLTAVQEGLADAEAGRVVTDQALTSELDAAFPPLEPS